ncbi:MULTISPECIES: RNA polymerase sigma factor [unclassified Sphingobium]|uniref:RNA polymerase sigma factor n=1 Tax=unclassified Sphingobium TaxID=2611147 RepID=UPI0035A6A3CF
MTSLELETAAPPSSAGLEAVYLAHRNSLLRFLRARGAGSDADDLVQELWVRVNLQRSGPVLNPLSYLYRAANNLMLNAFRSSTRNAEREAAWGEVHLTGNADDAEAGMVARGEIDLARQRLADCGARVQEIFFLFRIEGLCQRDIAARLGLSLSAVERDIQRAYRAIAALKDEERG